jgi:hypothetical protein
MASNRLYTFKDSVVDPTTKQVLATHTVKVVLSNFDGENDNSVKLTVK